MTMKKVIITLILALILVIPAQLFAATDSFKIKMITVTPEIKRGEVLEISLYIDNISITTGEKGIGAYEGTIEYDTNVFSDIKLSGNDNWDKPAIDSGRFSSTNADAQCVSQTQEIAKIKLTIKEDATLGNTNIIIKDFAGSNKLTNIPTEDITLTVRIIEEEEQQQNQNGAQTPIQDEQQNQNGAQTPIQDEQQNQDGAQTPIQDEQQNQDGAQTPTQDEQQNQDGAQTPTQDEQQNQDGAQTPTQDEQQNQNGAQTPTQDEQQNQDGTQTLTQDEQQNQDGAQTPIQMQNNKEQNANDNTVSKSNIPQTGEVTTIMTILTVIALIGIVSYVAYKKTIIE